MRFKFHGMSEAEFKRWADGVKAGQGDLDHEGIWVLEAGAGPSPSCEF
jgi:cytochrome o ubiquinol oxidase subunit 2